MAELIRTISGPRLAVNGHLYRKNYAKQNYVYYVCDKRKSLRCKAAGKTRVDRPLNLIMCTMTHNHDPETDVAQKEEFKLRLLQRCETETTPLRQIYEEESSLENEDVKNSIPFKRMLRRMQRTRKMSPFKNDMIEYIEIVSLEEPVVKKPRLLLDEVFPSSGSSESKGMSYPFDSIIDETELMENYTEENIYEMDLIAPTLEAVIEKLTEFAPLSLAESWDNVGLLIDQNNKVPILKILLTNDLTKEVTEEAIGNSINLIISYHPPIFRGSKKITFDSMTGFNVLHCISNNIAVYSPHTSWDSVKGGVTDWIANLFDYVEISAIKPLNVSHTFTKVFTVESAKPFDLKCYIDSKSLWNGTDLRWQTPVFGATKLQRYVALCTDDGVKKIEEALIPHDFTSLTTRVVTPETNELDQGVGRICILKHPISINNAIIKLKKHFGISMVQIALAPSVTLDHEITTIGIVAGSGGSILKDVKSAELLITGEASHHEILSCTYNGASIILTNHSNSERGYLTVFREILTSLLSNELVSVEESKVDRDPLIAI